MSNVTMKIKYPPVTIQELWFIRDILLSLYNTSPYCMSCDDIRQHVSYKAGVDITKEEWKATCLEIHKECMHWNIWGHHDFYYQDLMEVNDE